MLLTIVGKDRNAKKVWNSERTTTYKNGWGHEPTLSQYIQIECNLKLKKKLSQKFMVLIDLEN